MLQELLEQTYQCSYSHPGHVLPCAIALINWPYCKTIIVAKTNKYYCLYTRFAILMLEHPLANKAAG